MSPAAILKIVIDLLNQADKIRADHPEEAAAIEARSEELLSAIAGLSVAEVAELLGQSRPTIYEWVKAGYLVSEDAAMKGMSISPTSLMTLIPILHQWEEDGRQGRPTRVFREWFDRALNAREEEDQFAARRRGGHLNLKLARRATAEPVAAR